MRPFSKLSPCTLAVLGLPAFVAAALDPSTMSAHLAAGQALLGSYSTSSNSLASWMSSKDDAATLQSLSIPGTHDSLTWNVSGIAAAFTKTQDLPLFEQLNNGARFIDLRIGENNGMVQLYHSTVLLDQTAQLEDIFWGLYKWLDDHTSETLIVSVKVDNGASTATLQQKVYDLVTGQDTAAYWVQSTTFPTLADARHKAILLRRFAFDQLQTITPVGIEASAGWADNNASFNIPYGANGEALYIEDFYDVGGSDLATAVDAKFNALSANLDLATGGSLANQMFISFASGYSGAIVTPQGLATGNSTEPGVNTKAVQYLAGKRGSNFGVVLFDYFGSDSRLAAATLSEEVNVSASATGPASATGSDTVSSLGGASTTSSPFALSTLFIAAGTFFGLASL